MPSCAQPPGPPGAGTNRTRARAGRCGPQGALPVAEQATAAAQQPLALADRYAGREGLAATRTIDPYEGGGSAPLRQGFAMPPPLGRQGEAFFRFRGGG